MANLKFSHKFAYANKREGAVMSETEYAIGRTCGVTFAGIKPASLVAVRKRGKATLARLGRSFCRKGFSFTVLREQGERVLVCVYHAARLEQLLLSAEVRAFLGEQGYRYATAGEAVETLKQRMAEGGFPHEVGVFLGYPLRDVRGFIADPYGGTPCGAWKAYGDEEGAQRTSERWRRCSQSICRMMDSGKSLTQIFGVG